MNSASILTAHDRCARREYLERSWERNSLHPSQILRRAIEAGLQDASDDPGQAAGDAVMSLCVSRPIETESPHLLQIAEHTASLADMIAWTVRTGEPWTRPEDATLGNHRWQSSAFLGASGARLRKLICVDRWPEEGNASILNAWDVQGECAVYGMEMDLLVCVIGQRREERWHSAWTKGLQHPVNQVLRLQKRDGEAFGSTWEKVWRENFTGTREDWLDACTDDGVLPEILIVHSVEIPVRSEEIRALAEKKLQHIQDTVDLPEPQLSNCFSPISPCPFNSCCPNWRLPTEKNGFVSIV